MIYLDGKPINFNKWNVKHLTYTICTLCIFEDTNWESIDISKWNTSYLAETRDMFGACNKKIYVSKSFPLNSISSSQNMFYGCVSLIGGAGTTYDPTFIDATAARIDGGSENPGYFTDIKDKAAESVADQTPSADNSEDEESTDTNN